MENGLTKVEKASWPLAIIGGAAIAFLFAIPPIFSDVAEEYFGDRWARIIALGQATLVLAIASIAAFLTTRHVAKLALSDEIDKLSDLEARISKHDLAIGSMTDSHGEKLDRLADEKLDTLTKLVEIKINTLDKEIDKITNTLFSLERAYEAASAEEWYLSAKQYANREQQIIRMQRNVTVFVISDSLFYDTDSDLLVRAMMHNIQRGVKYRYITKRGLERKKDEIRDNAKRAADSAGSTGGCCGDVKFYEVVSEDVIFAFDYAIFFFSDPDDTVTLNRSEAYMALENGSEPQDAPWMKLRGESKDIIENYVFSITPEKWKN